MKNPKILFTAAFFLCATITSFGQETDDMYFNSKDRAELNAKKITADLGLTKRSDVKDANSPINPTDSYSARNINPEYASRLNSGSEVQVENDYFLPDFQPTGINQNLSNCNCSGGSYYNPNSFYGGSAFNNPYYGNMGGFGSPYGGFYPSSWGYPSYGYNSGLSMSMGYGLGGFNPGFYGGLGYGYGSYSGNFWNSFYSPWGGYYGSYYPGQVIVINNGGDAVNRVSYSKRSSRSSNVNHNVNYTRPSSAATVSGTGRSSISGGRTRTNSPEYYDSGWRRSQNTGATRGYWSTYGNSNNNTTTSDFNRGGSNFGGRQNTGFSSPSRSTFNSGGVNSGGSRSSGSSGSSGGSRTRGRNN